MLKQYPTEWKRSNNDLFPYSTAVAQQHTNFTIFFTKLGLNALTGSSAIIHSKTNTFQLTTKGRSTTIVFNPVKVQSVTIKALGIVTVNSACAVGSAFQMCTNTFTDLHIYICSDKDTSTALDRLHWLRASLIKEASTVLGKSIPSHQERATADMALWCSPSNAHLAMLPSSYVTAGQPWLEEDLTSDVLF